LGGGGGQFIIS